MRVDFVIGGTQKGGTSALHSFLRQHPELCLPEKQKELHFFDREENFRESPNYKKYHANFAPAKSQRVLGEATPIYMYWNAAPQRIADYNPAMKWILILRDPVERAFSHWHMEKKRGAENLPFAEAIEKEKGRCREALPLQHRVYSYIDRGFYARQLQRLFEIFGKENCHALLTEDLSDAHAKTLRAVFKFLGVSENEIPPAARVFEQDYADKIDNDLRERLIEIFYADIKELECLLDRNLSKWYSKNL